MSQQSRNTTKFLEKLEQGFERTISWNKYRSEIISQSKNNDLGYMIYPTFRNVNKLFVQFFTVNDNDDDDFPEKKI